MGRFLTQDTYPVDYSNPLELNRYVYVANNPIRHTDPSGHLIAEIAVQVKNYWQAAQQTAVARMVIGAAAGAVLSGFHASFMYDMARNGHCGDNLKDWTLRTDRTSFISVSVGVGGASGALIGALPPNISGPIMSGIGLFGAGMAVLDASANGLTPCNVTAFIMGIAGGLGGNLSVRLPFLGGTYTLALVGGGTISAGVSVDGVVIGASFPTIMMMASGSDGDGDRDNSDEHGSNGNASDLDPDVCSKRSESIRLK